jgi:AAHS family 4-hydroxybenzoate transporter-like MFS transporter
MHLNVSEVIDRSPVGSLQWRVVVLCALVALLDGLDIQTMALVTPVVAADWGLPASGFGLVLSATFAGIMGGALVGGLLGDRFGRRMVLILAFVLVGLTSILTAFAETPEQLMLFRLLTGFGIGACMPNFTALTAEYVPAKRVGFFVTLMYSAVPLGGVAGGYLAPGVIAAFGWEAVFIVGGAIPLVIALALLLWLPESIRFLVNRGADDAKVGAYLERIDRGYRYDPSHTFEVHQRPKGGSLPVLFTEGRTLVTLLLWLVFFFSLFGMYLLVSWLPTVFAAQGWPRAQAIQSASNFQLGGIVGGITLGWLIDRFGPYPVLTPAFLAAALLTAAIGVVGGGLGVIMVVIALSGFAIVGAQLGMTALAATIYPTSARSTGVGWALGIGRSGAVISPMVGGMALAAGWDRQALFAGAAVAPFLCALAILALWAASRRQAAGAAV